MRGRRGVRWASILFFAVAVSGSLLIAAMPIGAAAPDEGTPIGAGIMILGASVTAPSGATRALNSNQAAAFMQSWLPASIFGNVPNENPPKTVPVSRLSVPYTYGGTKQNPMLVYYASDRQGTWVGMPRQALWPGAFVTAERWVRAPDPARTTAAFQGKVAAIPLPGSAPSTIAPATGREAAKPTSTSGGTSAGTWALLGVGVAVLAPVAVGAALRVRRSRAA